jgi:diguanylate cyclase (GGDEF)-like protein
MDALHQFQLHQEELRLEALGRYGLLDTAAEGSFDSITKLAAVRLRAPIAVVSLVDRSRAWFKSCHGINVREVPCSLSTSTPFLPDEALWISDTENAAGCPLPEEIARGVRFYAAAPLKTYHGFNLGTLSVMDYQPRDLDPREIGELQDLAASVMKQIETRRLKHRFRRSRSMFQPKARQHCRSVPVYRTPTFDPLTALPDRRTLMDRLGKLLQTGGRPRGVLLVVDVDRFRILNGELGYAIGDQILTEVARRLEAVKGSQDTIARLGSDEFALLLSAVDSDSTALQEGQRLRDHLMRPMRLSCGEQVVGVRVGATSIDGKYLRSDEVLRDAELALAEAKLEQLIERGSSWLTETLVH